jgi:hypothetical protein
MTDDDRHANQSRLRDEDLARLADGSLPRSERAGMEARVAGSPELRARLREQERAVALAQSTSRLGAPDTLRASLGELTNAAGRGRGRRERREVAVWRPRASIALALLAMALIAIVSVALHGTTAPTVPRTARLALAPASGPTPAADAGNRDLLALRPRGATGIRFPSYVRATGWRASGARRDTLDGRRVTTVFYSSGRWRVGYSVVSGAALAMPRGSTVWAAGVRYVIGSSNGLALIAWRRAGHTCVIAGRSVSRRTLLALAAADEQT